MFRSIQPQLRCGGKHDWMDLVSRQDLVSLARHLHGVEFLHVSQQMLGQAQTRAGTAVTVPGPVFRALVSASGDVPWSPWCQRLSREQAGWENR